MRRQSDAESFRDMGPFGCGKRCVVKFGGDFELVGRVREGAIVVNFMRSPSCEWARAFSGFSPPLATENGLDWSCLVYLSFPLCAELHDMAFLGCVITPLAMRQFKQPMKSRISALRTPSLVEGQRPFQSFAANFLKEG